MKAAVNNLITVLIISIACLFSHVSLVGSQVVVKEEGVANPINFVEAIYKLKQTIDFSNTVDTTLLSDFKSEFNLNDFLFQSFNSILSETPLKITPVCHQLLTKWTSSIEKKQLWALTGILT
jgi:hypothetical protein